MDLVSTVSLVLVTFGCSLFDGPYEYFNIGIMIMVNFILIHLYNHAHSYWKTKVYCDSCTWQITQMILMQKRLAISLSTVV